jgi:hypothetical protein
MTDFLYISHNFGKEGIAQLEKFLRDKDLMAVAHYDKYSITAGLCSIRLPLNDLRIDSFIQEIEKTGNKPFIRLDREYSKTELNSFEYLVLNIRTVGLDNPGKKQKYNFSNSCEECGAGVEPISPLIIPINSMGKKLIDFTAHNNWLIFRKEIAEKTITKKFSGISFHPAIIGRNVDNFLWGKIDNILPKLNTKSKIRFNEAKCNTCINSGNFTNFETETAFIYPKNLRSSFKDYNLTNEFFGEWKYSKMGGGRLVIVNQKVRQFLMQEKVKNLDFEPIEFI